MNNWLLSGGIVAAFVLWLSTRAGEEESEEFPEVPRKPAAVPAQVWRWRDACVRAGNLTSEDPDLLLAMLWQESLGDPEADHSTGEKGLMGVTPAAIEDVTGERREASDDPRQQIYEGAKYARKCRRDYTDGSDWAMLRCYNEGPPSPAFTRPASAIHAQRVLDKYETIQAFWESEAV